MSTSERLSDQLVGHVDPTVVCCVRSLEDRLDEANATIAANARKVAAANALADSIALLTTEPPNNP